MKKNRFKEDINNIFGQIKQLNTKENDFNEPINYMKSISLNFGMNSKQIKPKKT